MKKWLLGLTFFNVFFSGFAQKPGAVIDILHYSYAIRLSDSNDEVNGRAKIRFVVLKETTTVTLDLVKTAADKKGMSVISVLEDNQPTSYIHDQDLLKVNFGRKLPAGTEKEIEVVYHGVPREGLIIGNNKYKHRGFFADHWPNRAHNWLPCVDHPADKAMVDFLVTAPEHYQVVANGVQVEETSLGAGMKLTHYRETVPLPTKVMVIGAADFAVELADVVNCIPVYSWVYPEDRDKGFYDYGQAASILPFYINNIGPYGYKKLANVQSKTTYGGLENASAIFYFENSITGKRISESLLAHEIAHQWFGNMATEKEWAHIWLSEGFATYMTILYMESQHGKDTADKMLIQNRTQTIAFSKRKMRPVVDSAVTDYMDLLNANSYQKGGWVLHMLRSQLGDSVFWKSIRTYYARYAGKNASTEDLRGIFEEVSGVNLSVFFKQWLYTPGQPQLEIVHSYDAVKKVLTVTITQQQEALFQFPLELQIRGGQEDGLITKSTPIKDKQTSFAIPMTEKPLKLVPDPNVKLLFEGVVKEKQ
jgi:aminopeptidase N